MSMDIQIYDTMNLHFDRMWIEQIILELADAFDIRVMWTSDTAACTVAFALAGGLLGGYAGGRLGAVLGAGIGGAATLVTITLREMWSTVREKLSELCYIVFNYLRRIDPVDYIRAFDILMACTASRRELVYTILDFVAHKLGREVISNIAAA